jgi:hypothetical protein
VINDPTQIEDDALKVIAETDVMVVDPITGEIVKIIAGNPIPVGYEVLNDDVNDDRPKS